MGSHQDFTVQSRCTKLQANRPCLKCAGSGFLIRRETAQQIRVPCSGCSLSEFRAWQASRTAGYARAALAVSGGADK